MITRATVRRILPVIISITVPLILIAGFIIFPIQAAEPADLLLEEAPARQGPQQQPPVVNGHGTGFVAPAIDLSHLTGRQLPAGLAAVEPSLGAPASFDWRDYNVVTSIKNQGICGSCYAFAALANFESRVLIAGQAVLPAPDYSENYVKECNYWETAGIDGGTSCDGGNFDIAADLLAQTGTVQETCNPYVASDVACSTGCPYQKTVLDWRYICADWVPDTEVLKTYIQTYGPVAVSMYSGFSGFGSYDGSSTLYYTGTDEPDHAVCIVGWDDSLTHAGGSGGWIVKNSWDTDWGDNGYFTIAYGSASIGMYSAFVYDWQDYDPNGQLYYFDECGGTNSWGESGGGNTTAWGLCKFTPSSNGYVSRVEFTTWDVTTDVDVYLYDSFNGTSPSGLLASKLNNSFDEAGYHSVKLDTPVAVTTGDDITAVVKFTNESYGYPVVSDDMGPAETGRCYISLTGTSGSWYDLGAGQSNDVCIRLRTTVLEAGAGGPYSGSVDESVAISGSATGGTPPYTYQWDLDNDSLYDDATGQEITHAWSVADTYTIGLRVTDDDGLTDTDTASVTVSEGGWDPWDYDEDENGIIEILELLTAAVDYFAEDITIMQLLEVVSLYFS